MEHALQSTTLPSPCGELLRRSLHSITAVCQCVTSTLLLSHTLADSTPPVVYIDNQVHISALDLDTGLSNTKCSTDI